MILHTLRIPTVYGDKMICVYHGDITQLAEPIDILCLSTTRQGYLPSPNTLIDSLWRKGINVFELAQKPDIDMRRLCKTWLSAPIHNNMEEASGYIGRIGCIEFSKYSSKMDNGEEFEKSIMNKIAAFFRMLDAAETSNVSMHTVAMPMLGGGAQGIRYDLILIPLLREIVEFLLRSKETRRILLVDKSEKTAQIFKQALISDAFTSALKMMCNPDTLGIKKQAFISYSHKDAAVIHLLSDKIKKSGIDVWVAEHSIEEGVYADRIATAIQQSGIFIPVMSRNSLYSRHVLSEVNMAFNRISSARLLMPLFIDRTILPPAFEYYLNALECAYAVPPTDSNLENFISKISHRYNDIQL